MNLKIGSRYFSSLLVSLAIAQISCSGSTPPVADNSTPTDNTNLADNSDVPPAPAPSPAPSAIVAYAGLWLQLDITANFAKTLIDTAGHFSTDRNACGKDAFGPIDLVVWNQLVTNLNLAVKNDPLALASPRPSVSPSISPLALTSPLPSSSPIVSPSATPSASPRPSATPSPTPSPTPTPTDSPLPENHCVPINHGDVTTKGMDGTVEVELNGGKRLLYEQVNGEICTTITDPAVADALLDALDNIVRSADKEDCPNGWGSG